MTFISFLVFLVPALTGILFVHLFWSDRTALAVLFKLFLGAGIGLGINSILCFIALLSGMEGQALLIIQTIILVLLVVITLRKEHSGKWAGFRTAALSPVQLVLLGATLLTLVLSGATYLNLTQARPQGTHDAWSIWNRAARFIYRDPGNWLATASPDLYWATHPDYPLLVPLNVAWGWAITGGETQRIPQVQSALFTFATIGLVFASTGLVRSLGQASLASIVIMITPILWETAYAQISDIPLTFFILATCILMYLYFKEEKPVLLLLSGFTAGLAAWTKNEGLLFVLVSFLGLMAASRRNIIKILPPYLAGLAVPMAVVLYFKLAVAPENDIFSLGEGNTMALVTDLSRYRLVLQVLLRELWNYAGWPVSIFVLLALYAVMIRLDIPADARAGTRAIATIVFSQILGYCAIFLLTPHDLSWHLNFSFARLMFHVYPAAIFLYFCSITEPEKIFVDRLKPETAI